MIPFFCKVDNKGLARADDLSSPKTVIFAETCLNLLTLCPRYIGEVGRKKISEADFWWLYLVMLNIRVDQKVKAL